jgi:hypothetical protein
MPPAVARPMRCRLPLAVRRVGPTALLSPALTARGEHQIRLGGVEPSPVAPAELSTGLRTMRRRIDSFAIGNARTNLRGLSASWFD